VAVQLLDVLGDQLALRVVPRTRADAIPRVLLARAQVRAPGLVACADRFGERLAVRIRAREPAEVAAVAGIGARDEEAHVLCGLLREHRGCAEGRRCGEDAGE